MLTSPIGAREILLVLGGETVDALYGLSRNHMALSKPNSLVEITLLCSLPHGARQNIEVAARHIAPARGYDVKNTFVDPARRGHRLFVQRR